MRESARNATPFSYCTARYSVSPMAALRPPAYAVTLAAVLLMLAAAGIGLGNMSPDSWYYALLAQGLQHGHGCSVNGQYLAAYPCGYPAFLALITPFKALAAFMITSKLGTLLLLGTSAAFIWLASGNRLMAAIVIANPVTLGIGLYTWSENLELFCICGTLYGVWRICTRPDATGYAVLSGCLLVGCVTRYFFGPFAFLMFMAGMMCWGWRPMLRVLPCFAIAGLVFVGYQALNTQLSGFATGMARMPAAEAPWYLVRRFLTEAGLNGLGALLAAAVILAPFLPRLRLWAGKDQRAATFLLLSGVAFLALAFWLRFRTSFDPYNMRTVGFGAVFVIVGLAGRFIRIAPGETRVTPHLALLLAGILSLLLTDDQTILNDLTNGGPYVFPFSTFDNLIWHGQPDAAHGGGAVVFFALPPPSLTIGYVDNVPEIYYRPGTELITPEEGPDGHPPTARAFLTQIAAHDGPCIADFRPFANAAELRSYAETTIVTDHRFGLGIHDQTVTKPAFNPSFAAWLEATAVPGKVMTCAELLNRPASRAILAN